MPFIFAAPQPLHPHHEPDTQTHTTQPWRLYDEDLRSSSIGVLD